MACREDYRSRGTSAHILMNAELKENLQIYFFYTPVTLNSRVRVSKYAQTDQ